jgi:hypothetical protein
MSEICIRRVEHETSVVIYLIKIAHHGWWRMRTSLSSGYRLRYGLAVALLVCWQVRV